MSEPSAALAAVFEAPQQPLALRRIELPTLGAGELLVEVSLCTLCGSDLHTLRGARPAAAPSILGHEAVGRVLGRGAGVAVGIGERVTWSIAASCGSCGPCSEGMEQKCDTLWKYGHEECAPPSQLSGGLAEVIHLREGTTVVPVPDSIPDAAAAPANCATATVAAALRVAGPLASRRVLVLGAGLLGLTAAAMARSAGAARVHVVDPEPQRRSMAGDFGATTTSDPAGVPETDTFDVCLELSGNPAAVEQALERVGLGGCVVLVGSVASSREARFDPERVVRGLVRIEGVHNYRPEDLRAAVGFLEGPGAGYPFASLVGAEHPLEEVGSAILEALQGGSVRVGVRPRP